MKKNLKLLISSTMIALTFASSQAVHGMEDLSKPGEQGVKSPHALSVSGGSDITEESRQKNRRSDEICEYPFVRFPSEIRFNILEHAVIYNYLSNGHTAPLKLVCKEWHGIINKDFVNRAILSAYELLGYGEIYQRFLKGVLVYRPQEGSDVGMIKLPIAALSNPLEGMFDLSQCGDTGKYLSISTGYRKKKKAENANKVEIWFAPRFLIEKELKTTATHFQEIYSKWNDTAAVGIFWTWGNWDNMGWYDYLTMENMDDLSNINLHENWQKAHGHGQWLGKQSRGRSQKFSCSFCELK